MKKQTKTLAIALLALTCVSAGVGAGVVANDFATGSVITASAETAVRTITKTGSANASNATALYVYAMEGDECPAGVASWDHAYSFVAGSGEGIKFNGEAIEGGEVKQPGNDLYITLGGKTAVAGDEITFDGEFYSEAADCTVKFVNCALRYNGTTWDSFTPATEYVIGTLAATGDSSATVVYAYPVNQAQKPTVNSWDYFFTFVEGSGAGAKWNGEAFTLAELKQPGDFYIVLGKTAVEGDVLTLDGAFYGAIVASR